MDKLKGEQLKLACSVKMQTYKACMKTAVTNDLILGLDVNAPTRKCGATFAELQEFCSEHLADLLLSSPAKKADPAPPGGVPSR